MDVSLENVVSYLLKEEKTSIINVTKQLGIDEKRVYESINIANSQFSGVLTIKINNGILWTHVLDKKNIYHQMRFGAKQDFNHSSIRIAYLLKELILKEAYLSISDFAEKMLVSRSTVNNDLRKAKQLVQKYNVEIEGIPNRGITIKGTEFSLRLILIYEIYDQLNTSYLFAPSLDQKIQQINDRYHLMSSKKHLFYKTLAVSIFREQAELSINRPIPMYDHLSADSSSFEDLFQLLNQLFSISIDRNFKDFITFPINTRNSSFGNFQPGAKNEEFLRGVVHEIVQDIKWNYMLKIDEEVFYNKIKYHLSFLINRLIFRLPTANDEILSTQLKQQYPLAYELARISMNVLRRTYQLSPTEIDLNYFSIYFAIILNEKGEVIENMQNEPHSIAVVTNKGKGVFEFIKQQIQEMIREPTNIEHLTTIDATNQSLAHYSIVFSTEQFLHPIDIPIVKLDSFIETHEEISRSLQQATARSAWMNTIHSFIDMDYHRIQKGWSYRKIMQQLIWHYQREEKVSSELYRNFIKKEKEHSMIYENGVAFPHLVDPYAEKLYLSVAQPTAEKTKENIELVIFLIVPSIITNKQEQLLTEIYDRVFAIIGNKELKQEMKEMPTIIEFFNLFTGGKNKWTL